VQTRAKLKKIQREARAIRGPGFCSQLSTIILKDIFNILDYPMHSFAPETRFFPKTWFFDSFITGDLQSPIAIIC
jgi:hypothetical protein